LRGGTRREPEQFDVPGHDAGERFAERQQAHRIELSAVDGEKHDEHRAPARRHVRGHESCRRQR
jgi:hypothetical protein